MGGRGGGAELGIWTPPKLSRIDEEEQFEEEGEDLGEVVAAVIAAAADEDDDSWVPGFRLGIRGGVGEGGDFFFFIGVEELLQLLEFEMPSEELFDADFGLKLEESSVLPELLLEGEAAVEAEGVGGTTRL